MIVNRERPHHHRATNSRLTSESFAHHFLKELAKAVPNIEPTHCGWHEPVSKPYKGWEDAMQWDFSFLWRVKNASKCEGTAFSGNQRSHGFIAMSLAYDHCSPECLQQFLESSAIRMEASFAYMHCVTDMESEGPFSDYDRWYPLSIGVTTHDLRKGIPELPWLTIFGGEYRSMIGDDALREVSAASSRASGSSHWILTVTERLEDVLLSYDRFSSQREAIKREIGVKYFYGSHANTGKVCVPEFVL